MDEVWWVSRDSGSDIVEIRDRKPKMVDVDGNKFATGDGCGVFVMIQEREFREISGFEISDGEIIPIRPLRIERVEVEE